MTEPQMPADVKTPMAAGRDEDNRGSGLILGNDLKTHEVVTLDASHARVALICGKRGSGKSYALGVMAEELFWHHSAPLILLVDPMGIFWTMSQAASSATQALPVTLLVPGDPSLRYPPSFLEHLHTLGITIKRITLPPSALSSDAWCALFGLSINEPLGIALYRATTQLAERQRPYALMDLRDAIERDPLSQDRTKEALLNRVSMAHTWGLFETAAASLNDVLISGTVHVLDLSTIEYSTHGLRSLVLAVFTQQLFNASCRLRQQFAQSPEIASSKVWLLIDEAHQFIPQGQSTLAKDALIRWVKEGRQPGLSCVLASQQPGSLDQEVLSQCDTLLAHKLTNLEDVTALNRLSQAYMGSELRVYLRHLKGPGQAVLVDDARERMAMLQVRERLTQHGGSE